MIQGTGLNGTNVEVKFDGVPCQVQYNSENSVTCDTYQA